MLNKATLVGYVGSEAEIRVLESGVKTASFRLATNETYVRHDGTRGVHVEWHSIVAWRAVAQAAERWAVRGAELYVEGAIRSRSVVDPNSKQEQTRYEIVAQIIRPADDSLAVGAPTQVSSLSPAPSASLAPQEEDPDGLPF